MKKKRTSWPRWAKTARNFLLALLLGLVIWNQLGAPLPYTAALRRVERQQLLPKMDHRVDTSRGYRGGGSIRFEWTEGAAVTSLYLPADARLTYFYDPFTIPRRLAEGPSLISVPCFVSLRDEMGQPTSHAVYAAVFPPANSVTADLTLHNRVGTFTVSAQREDDAFIFYARPEPDENGRRSMGSEWYSLEEFTYELTFYSETGEVVGGISG